MPASLDALLIALLAIAPGYIAAMFWSRARTREAPRSDLQVILQSLTLSLVVQVLAAPFTAHLVAPYQDRLVHHMGRVALWLALVSLIIPALLGFILGRFEDRYLKPTTQRSGQLHRLVSWIWPPSPPSAWDRYFDIELRGRSGYILIEFADGRRVAGTWDGHAHAATSPHPKGLILQKEWLVDDDGINLSHEIEGSLGLLVSVGDTIRTVRFMEPEGNRDGDGTDAEYG